MNPAVLKIDIETINTRNKKIRGKGPKAFHDAEIVGDAAVYAGPFIFFTNITCLVHLLLNWLFVLSRLSGSGNDF